MPDIIYLNEPAAELREVQIPIYQLDGSTPATGITESTSTIKISKPGSNFVASSAILTEVTGSVAGSAYRLRFAAGEVDTLGDLLFEITQPGDITPVRGYVTVRYAAMDEENEAGYSHAAILRLHTGLLYGRVTSFLTGLLSFLSIDGSKTRATGTANGTGRTANSIGDLSK